MIPSARSIDNSQIILALPKGRYESWSRVIAAALGVELEGGLLSGLSNDGRLRVLLLKARDVPQLVAAGSIAMGVAPKEWILEWNVGPEHPKVVNVARIPSIKTALSWFIAESDALEIAWPPPNYLRVATAFPRLANECLKRAGCSASVVALNGSVEAAVPSLAKIGFDCLESGETVRLHNLIVLRQEFKDLGLEVVTHTREEYPRGRCQEVLALLAKAAHTALYSDVDNGELSRLLPSDHP